MNRRTYTVILLLSITILACNDKPDIYKTKSGAYASKDGGFVAYFPRKPYVMVHENIIGNENYDAYSFQNNIGSF